MMQPKGIAESLPRETTQTVDDVKDFRHEPEPFPVSPSVVETDFKEFDDGSLIEMTEDPANPSRPLFAIYKDGEVRFAPRFQYREQAFVPISRARPLIGHVRLPRGVMKYESVYSLARQVNSIFSRCLDLDEEYRHVLMHFVLSTWLIDRLSVAPYVALVGLPGSGKSTGLSVLNLLCRRSLLTADVSSAAFHRVCNQLTPTLLIDETNTAGKKQALFHLLRTGTMRDAVVLRREQAFKTFGAKVVSWIELPHDTALNSRCIVIALRETRRTDLMRPCSPEILQAAEDLQKQLLMFRLEKLKSLSLPIIQGDDQLYSRARDLYEAMALPFAGEKEPCEWLLWFFKTHQEANREPLSPIQAAVLEVFFKDIHERPEKGTYGILDLTHVVNFFLGSVGERFRVGPREVGSALTSLGFTDRKRTNNGWVVWLDRGARRMVHELVTTYGIDNEECLPSVEASERCDFCKGFVEYWKAHPTTERDWVIQSTFFRKRKRAAGLPAS